MLPENVIDFSSQASPSSLHTGFLPLCTQIYVLEKGKVSETGSHAELLEQKGLYYAMWRRQVGEKSAR